MKPQQRMRVLALVLAGGQGSRMEVLTKERAKPAMPFAGIYRLIDLPMSNLRNSNIQDVWVVAQYETQSISDILAHGRPWDMDKTHGGFRMITPQQSADDEGTWHEGNADALYQLRHMIREYGPDVLLVLSADHVYRLDYNEPIAFHVENDADCTIVSTQVEIDQAPNHAVLKVDADGRVTDFDYKPDEAESDIIATEIFIYNPDVVLNVIEKIAAESGEGSGLEDFGHELLPYMIEHYTVLDWRLPTYWKDVGRPETYFKAHMDLIEDHPDLDLDDLSWRIYTRDHQRMPARIADSAKVSHALISPGCEIAGIVERSVLGAGVIVEEGATVRDAIILQDTIVKSGADIQFAIIDRDVTIGSGATIGERPNGDEPTTEELVLIGLGAKVHGRRVLKAGDRVEPEGEGVQFS